MKEKTLTIDSKHIEWVPYIAAKSSKQTIKSCYADMKKSGLFKQLQTMFENKTLPHYVKITGKKKMEMKIDTYQNDGFWFSTPEGEGDIRWRLWVGADKLLNPPVKSKILKQAKEEEQ